MDDTLRGFGSQDTFTLIVGAEEEKLYVTRPVLETIPYFQKALKGNKFKDSKEKLFKLPDLDPQILADVLYFAFSGHVKPVGLHRYQVQQRNAVKAYVKAYILADRLMAEEIANGIIDRLVEYHVDELNDPSNLTILSEAGLENCKLYQFLLENIAATLKNECDIEDSFPLLDRFIDDSKSMFTALSSADLTRLLQAVLSHVEDEEWWNPAQRLVRTHELCTLHEHKKSVKCPVREPDCMDEDNEPDATAEGTSEPRNDEEEG